MERMFIGVQDQCDVAANDWLRAVQTDSGSLFNRFTLVKTQSTGVRPVPEGVERVVGHGDVKVGQSIT